jgi:hypothetical protein
MTDRTRFDCRWGRAMTAQRQMPTRPTFVLRLQAQRGVDPVRSLRALLKVALRRFGLRCVEAREEGNRIEHVATAAER